jgi:hypothetical protein
MKLSPFSVALLLGGLLLFGVVGVVRWAVGAADVSQALQNSVAGAVAAPVSRRPTIPAIGDVEVDNFGYRFVWLGRAWLSCRHLDPASLVYDTANIDAALTSWSVMTVSEKREYARICYGE